MRTMYTQSFLLLLLLPILSNGIINGMENTPKPQYDDFRTEWIKDSNRSYYTLLGLNETATKEEILNAADPKNITWGITTFKSTKRAAIQEIMNARRLLTENDAIRNAYDTNLGSEENKNHVHAKNIAIAKFTAYTVNEENQKPASTALTDYKNIIEDLITDEETEYSNVRALYDPAYNKSIVIFYQAAAEKFAQDKDFKKALEVISELRTTYETLRDATENSFTILEGTYPKELLKQLKTEYLSEVDSKNEESVIILESKYKEQSIKKPSKPIIPVEVDNLTPSLATLTQSLKNLETALKK